MVSVRNREKYIKGLQNYLVKVARNKKYVTSDDAQSYLTKAGISPRMVRTRVSLINSVLRRPNFKPVAEVASNRPSARGRTIRAWKAR